MIRAIFATCFLLGFSATLVADDACNARHIDETVSVTKVFDGDTLRLADKRVLRFIGINTPEIDHKHGQTEPLAETARDELIRLIGRKKQVNIQYGSEQKDRHGRLLVHVFAIDGTNIQQSLLRQGLLPAGRGRGTETTAGCMGRTIFSSKDDRGTGSWYAWFPQDNRNYSTYREKSKEYLA